MLVFSFCAWVALFYLLLFSAGDYKIKREKSIMDIEKKDMKTFHLRIGMVEPELIPTPTTPTRRLRPSGITTLALFEFLGAIGCVGLLFFTAAGSRDFIALSVAAAFGFVVVYGLWTLRFWAFWCTAVYESLEIAYELFLLTQPEYRGIHVVGPIFGIVMSAITLGYIFLDRSVKPVFRRTETPA
jgi:hypothetical protein